MKQPELLAPAGNYEKAMIAFRYGADAVYVGGTVFGLRKYADNVSDNELQKLITYANKNQKAVYVVLNAFAHNSDITLHIENLQGSNGHHVIESCYKGLARCLKEAISIDPRMSDSIPTTKGIL